MLFGAHRAASAVAVAECAALTPPRSRRPGPPRPNPPNPTRRAPTHARQTQNRGFLLLAFNQISNNCGMLHYTSGGQFKVPMVIRGPGGVGRQLGAEHSQRLESYFQSIPGVQLVACSTVANAKGLLKVRERAEKTRQRGCGRGCRRRSGDAAAAAAAGRPRPHFSPAARG